MNDDQTVTSRRRVLGSAAGLGALAALPGAGSAASAASVGTDAEFEKIAAFEDATGDGMVSGAYTMPTNDAYYEGAWDVASFSVETSQDRVRFNYTMAEEIQNPWGFAPGFCHQMFQIYVNSPTAKVEAGTAGRGGTNLTFDRPYHYRIVVHGEGTMAVEEAAGDAVSTDVNTAVDGDTVSIDVPKSALEWSHEETDMGIQPVVLPYDGFGTMGVRPIHVENGSHTFGGGTGTNDPAAMDIFTPEGEDQAAILSDYSADSLVSLPLVSIDQNSVDSDTGSSDGGTGNETDDDTSDEVPPANDSDEHSDGSPGPGILGALASLGAAGRLLARRADGGNGR